MNLSQVTGTGLNGRITKNDVLNFVESGKSATDHGPQTTVNRPPSTVVAEPIAGDQLIKHTNMRRSIAQHMLDSKRISPQVLSVMEADMSRVLKHFAANEAAFARDGITLTLTAYFMIGDCGGVEGIPNSQFILDG